MKRRKFIKFTALTTLVFCSNISIARVFTEDNIKVLDVIYEILFPKTANMPSSKEFGALEFLIKNISHKSFEDYDKTFIIQGCEDFLRSFPDFLIINKQKQIIESIVNTNDYAQSWISKLIYYGFEAMLGDPIYGGNRNKIAWSSINHSIGYPRPKLTYGQRL